MLTTILKVVGVIGSLALAGVSAYTAYKKSTNLGTHTMNTLQQVGYYGNYNAYGQYPVNNNGYAAYANNYYNNANYGYGYSNAYTPPIQQVTQTGVISIDMETAFAMLNKMNAEIQELRNELARIQAAKAQKQHEIMLNPSATNAGIMMNTTSNANNNPANTAWENAGDTALSIAGGRNLPAVIPTPTPTPTPTPAPAPAPVAPVMPAPVQSQTQNTQINQPVFSQTVMSELGRAALNSNYMFNMAKGFDQYYESDMRRRVAADRIANYQPKYCDTYDPYGGIPSYITGNNYNPQNNSQVNPYTQSPYQFPCYNGQTIATGIYNQAIPCSNPNEIFIADSEIKPIEEESKPINERSFSYGHIGEPIPQHRYSMKYGNVGDGN